MQISVLEMRVHDAKCVVSVRLQEPFCYQLGYSITMLTDHTLTCTDLVCKMSIHVS